MNQQDPAPEVPTLEVPLPAITECRCPNGPEYFGRHNLWDACNYCGGQP